ncbi:MAG: hypothetical protein GXP53_00775 [Deltaproteobacteria bacterium]|nr:hypothetical protein [Deltaproteobacteria bacterium]
MHLSKLSLCLCLVCAAIAMSGCSTTRFMADSMVPMTAKMNLAVNKNTDIEMVRDAMPAGIIQLEGLLEASPENTAFMIQLAEAYYGYGFSFFEDTDPARASMLYEKSYGYAIRALASKKRFSKALLGPFKDFKPALQTLDKEDVPALFWAAGSRMSWIGLNFDNPVALVELDKVEEMLKRCCELDETFYYGAAQASLGAYFAARSPLEGGNPKLSRSHFERAFEISKGRMLTFYLLFAKYYAYQIQDKDIYLSTLKRIVSTQPDILPEKAFANAIARRKAKVMIEHVDDLF